MPSRTALTTMNNILAILRELDEDMPIQQAHLFITVAMRPGITAQQASEVTGISQSSTSRNVKALGEVHRLNKPGLDLIEGVSDPNDSRSKLLFLTIKGRAIARQIISQIDPTADVSDYSLPTAKDWQRGAFRGR